MEIRAGGGSSGRVDRWETRPTRSAGDDSAGDSAGPLRLTRPRECAEACLGLDAAYFGLDLA